MIAKTGLRMGALMVLMVIAGCGQRVPDTVYVIRPQAGQDEVSMEDKDKLRDALDAVAAPYGMQKAKPGQANIVRYYPPTAQLQVGFYAASENKRVVVYASPLSPGMTGDSTYTAFRQALEAKLREVFGAQLSVEQVAQP